MVRFTTYNMILDAIRKVPTATVLSMVTVRFLQAIYSKPI